MQPTTNFTTVVAASSGTPFERAYVAAARFGAGYVVGTAGNCGGAIAGMFPAGQQRVTNQDITLAELEDLKFAYNVFGWRAEVTAQQKDGRHTGNTNIQVNGLIEQGTYPYLVPNGPGAPWTPYNGVVTNTCSPLIVDNMVIAATTFGTPNQPINEINAFKANPFDDFDGNGFTDDGLDAAGQRNTSNSVATSPFIDISIGENFDRVMGLRIPQNGIITGMALGEVPDPDPATAGGSKAYVFAAGTSGLFSLPSPRPGLPVTDYWNAATARTAQPPNIAYLGRARRGHRSRNNAGGRVLRQPAGRADGGVRWGCLPGGRVRQHHRQR